MSGVRGDARKRAQESQPAPEVCPDCGHQYANGGCVGPPTPSDRWAGVSPSGCDCDGPCAEQPAPEVGLTEAETHIVTLHDRITGLVWSCTCRATGAGDAQRVRESAREHASDWLAERDARIKADAIAQERAAWVAKVETLHVRYQAHGADGCDLCRQPWPCETVALLSSDATKAGAQ